MGTNNHVIRLALEWFKASGPRTKDRLDSLVAHYAQVYGEPSVALLQQDAWNAYTRSEKEES